MRRGSLLPRWVFSLWLVLATTALFAQGPARGGGRVAEANLGGEGRDAPPRNGPPEVGQGRLEAAMTRVIERKLESDPTVPEYLVDVSVRDGVVTLSGSVPSLLARERAVRIARSIRGVQRVEDDIKVQIKPRPAEAIGRELNKAFRFDPAVDSSDIEMEVSDGVVVLNGAVQSWQEKRVAEMLARGVPGVRVVENQLQIEYPAGRLDDEIKKDVESRLKWDVLVDETLIKVQVEEGVVSLSGLVDSLSEKERAYADAWVAGVNAVNASGLRVAGDVPSRWQLTPTGRVTDRGRGERGVEDNEIEKAIARAYFEDRRVVSLNPTVEVENGTVTLSGIVNSIAARRAAEQIASEITGVVGVRNFLKVRPEGRFSDEAILRNVRQALIDDPQVEHEQIRIGVVDGTVYLSGAVDTVFERIKAQHLAAAVPGVRTIRNAVRIIADQPYDWWPPGGFYDDSERPSDEELEQSIREHLWFNPLVDASAVRVTVEDRVATLAGRVNSLHARREAEKEAYEGGARRVLNRLRIGNTSR